MRPEVRPELRSLEGYHSAQVEVDVRLNTNEAPLGPPPGFVDAVKAAVEQVEWNRYPDRSASALRQALGELHSVAAEEVFCANGSNEVLQTLLLTYGGPGRRVLTFEPTYALHSHLTRITGGEHVAVQRSRGFVLEPDLVEDAIRTTSPSVVFLCSPNNPTGRVEPLAVIESALAAAAEVGAVLVVDEAYGQFAPHTALSMLDDERPLAVSRTFSKTWAMANVRLGYLVAPRWLVAELEKVVLPYHLDSLKQAAGLAALEFVAEAEARVAGIVEERGRLSDRLAELGCDVTPSAANFVLFTPPDGDGRTMWTQLVERSVLVRDTSSWEGLSGSLRVTVGTPQENERFLEAVTAIVGGAQ